MGIENAIAAMSVSMSQAKVQNSVDIAILDKAMDQQEQCADTLIQDMLEAIPAPPGTGNFVDMLV